MDAEERIMASRSYGIEPGNEQNTLVFEWFFWHCDARAIIQREYLR